MTSERTDYSVVQKVLHWIMALLIVMDLFVAQKFGGVMEQLDRLESRVDHGSLGTIVLLLFIARIYFRVRHGAPALPEGMSQWQRQLAHGAHWALYGLIGLLILTGLATAANAASPIALFGQFDITVFGQTNEDAFQFVRQFHEFATNAVIALIVLHVAAALWHLVVRRDGSTERMLKVWKGA